VWRITFGQHSRTLASVQRDVDAKTGRVFARDALHSSFTELDQKPERFTRLLLPVGRTFDSLWPAVKDAVRKQDPRYRPYAVTLVTQLGEYQRAPSGGYLWMAHIRFVRETPSWMWDDLEAHLGWRADGQAVLDFSPPERLRGPRQVIPIVIDDRNREVFHVPAKRVAEHDQLYEGEDQRHDDEERAAAESPQFALDNCPSSMHRCSLDGL